MLFLNKRKLRGIIIIIIIIIHFICICPCSPFALVYVFREQDNVKFEGKLFFLEVQKWIMTSTAMST